MLQQMVAINLKHAAKGCFLQPISYGCWSLSPSLPLLIDHRHGQADSRGRLSEWQGLTSMDSKCADMTWSDSSHENKGKTLENKDASNKSNIQMLYYVLSLCPILKELHGQFQDHILQSSPISFIILHPSGQNLITSEISQQTA
jgi:hypothetical protein